MLTGSLIRSPRRRAASHSSSPQVYSEVNTTDAVAGGCSARLAIGSALRRHRPSAPQMSNL